jgi:hypothetical protein
MMLKEALASAAFAWAPTAALVIFAVFMLLVGAWIVRPGARKRYAAISTSMLDDEGATSHEA